MNEIKDLWSEIDDWLAQNASPLKERLNDGTTERMIREFSRNLFSPTDEMKTTWLCHNGQICTKAILPDLGRLISIEEAANWLSDNGTEPRPIEEKRQKLLRNRGAFPDEYCVNPFEFWPKSWVPFSSFGSNRFWAFDLTPADEGSVGQLIEIHTKSKRIEYLQLNGSLEDMLHMQLGRLKKHTYFFDDRVDCLKNMMEKKSAKGGFAGFQKKIS